MFHNRPALRAMNEAAWAALAWGAQNLADNPLPADPFGEFDDVGDPYAEPVCWNCNGTEEVTRDGPLGHIERKPCPECQREWW